MKIGIDVENAKKWLKKAIDRHMRHLNSTEPTDDESQRKLMDEMMKAYSAIGGEKYASGGLLGMHE